MEREHGVTGVFGVAGAAIRGIANRGIANLGIANLGIRGKADGRRRENTTLRSAGRGPVRRPMPEPCS